MRNNPYEKKSKKECLMFLNKDESFPPFSKVALGGIFE